MSYAVDHLFINVEITLLQSKHPWGEPVWKITQVELSNNQQAKVNNEKNETTIFWQQLKLEVHQLHCDAYYQNLMSAQPKIYLVCYLEANQLLRPQIITVDYDEANSYMESEQTVLIAPLPEPLCLWLERFVVNYYVPEQRKKRRRKKWHDNGK